MNTEIVRLEGQEEGMRVVGDQRINLRVKGEVYKTVVRPVMLYGLRR